MLAIVKNRFGAATKDAHRYRVAFPRSLEPLLEADLVLYDTKANRWTLFTRDRRTLEYNMTSYQGSIQGEQFKNEDMLEDFDISLLAEAYGRIE